MSEQTTPIVQITLDWNELALIATAMHIAKAYVLHEKPLQTLYQGYLQAVELLNIEGYGTLMSKMSAGMKVFEEDHNNG